MTQRKLASVQYVHEITPIEGADRIECVHVLGWSVVARKGAFTAGEFCGGGIQKNRLKLKYPEWYIFTVIDLNSHRRLGMEETARLCEKLGITMVPVEETGEKFPYQTVEELLERAKGKYSSGLHKEGIVIRPVQPVYSRTLSGPLSVKVLNNDYLLKE